jgi:hypothetical protein
VQVRYAPIFPALLLAALCTRLSFAQDDASHRFRLDPIQPASPTSPFFTVEGPAHLNTDGPSRLATSLLLDYARSPLTVHLRTPDGSQKLGSPVSDSLIGHATVGLALSDHFAAEVMLPFAIMQKGENVTYGSNVYDAPSGAAIGDLRLGITHRTWLSPKFGFILGARTWLPTGNQDAYLGDNRVRFELSAGVFGLLNDLRYGCTAHASPTFIIGRVGDRLALGCATDISILHNGPRIGTEVIADALTFSSTVGPGSHAEFLGTLRQSAGSFHFGLGVGPGVGTSPGTASVRVLASIAYAPQSTAPIVANPDFDFDDIPNDKDACPHEAGPKSTDPKTNGCPILDEDGDGIANQLDACPSEKGGRSDDPRGNGCPDKDNDHVADKVDHCPDEPGRQAADPIQNGCPHFVHLQGNRFNISVPLSVVSTATLSDQDHEVLQELAASLRAMPPITRISIEVTLNAKKTDLAAAQKAAEIASIISNRLDQLGINQDRLQPIGAISSGPSHIDIIVLDRQ